MPRFLRLILSILVLGTFLVISQQVLAQEWLPVRGGIPFGISGMALIQQQNNSLDFLVVHDNKAKNQGRLAIMSLQGKKQPEYFSLNWPSNTKLPIDLESLALIPEETKSSFIAVESSGKAYHMKLNTTQKTIYILQEFKLPEIFPTSNFEAFDLRYIDGKIVAIWAHRGEGKEPARIYWGEFNSKTYQIQSSGFADFQVPFPSGNVRHISDLKIDSLGIVYIASASDAGDDGPFQSAVYVAGYVKLYNNKFLWRPNTQLFPIYRSKYHKVEGLELVPGANGGVIVGTDDENLGSYVYLIGGE
jgi:hypothetical protein